MQTSPIKAKELDHIVLLVKDIEKSLHFYTEVLGLKPERLEQYRSGRLPFPSVRINDGSIIDLALPKGTQANSGQPSQNLGHFCITIEPTDMNELKKTFEAMGIEIESGQGPRWGARGTATSLYIYDPDRNVIELRSY